MAGHKAMGNVHFEWLQSANTWNWLILSISPKGTLLAQLLYFYRFGSAYDAKLRGRVIHDDLRKWLSKLITDLYVIEHDFHFIIYMLYRYGNLALVAIFVVGVGFWWPSWQPHTALAIFSQIYLLAWSRKYFDNSPLMSTAKRPTCSNIIQSINIPHATVILLLF